MHQKIIDGIFNQYKQNGYISEDTIVDALIENNVSLDKVDYICETLLSMGVIIKNDSIDKDDKNSIYDRSQTDYEEIFKEIIAIDEGMSFFIKELSMITPPQSREWYNLIVHAQNENHYAKDRIVLMYLRNVVKIALYHHKRYGISLSDAIQDGCIGLIISIGKFELNRQDNFSQYAPWWIRQYIMRNATPFGTVIRYPAHYKDKLFVTYEIMIKHSCTHCLDNKLCPELVEEVSNKLQCDYDEAITFIKSLSSELSYEDMLDKNDDTFSDSGLFEEELVNLLVNKSLTRKLETILSTLKDREQNVIKLRFGIGYNSNPKTLEEIGAIFGLTRERIRQIESKAIRKLIHPVRGKILKQFW